MNDRTYVAVAPTGGCTGCAFATSGWDGRGDPGCRDAPECPDIVFKREEDLVPATPEMDEVFVSAPTLPADVSQRPQYEAVAGSCDVRAAIETYGITVSLKDFLAADVKPSNPKDAIGAKKLPLDLVPDSILVLLSMSFAEGASKYGAFNWRVAGVRVSIYIAAMRRHVAKWLNGEERDPKTKVPHLASAMACLGIIEDARLCGKLTDDRPPAADIPGLIAEAEDVVAGLWAMHAHLSPVHHTQAALSASAA